MTATHLVFQQDIRNDYEELVFATGIPYPVLEETDEHVYVQLPGKPDGEVVQFSNTLDGTLFTRSLSAAQKQFAINAAVDHMKSGTVTARERFLLQYIDLLQHDVNNAETLARIYEGIVTLDGAE